MAMAMDCKVSISRISGRRGRCSKKTCGEVFPGEETGLDRDIVITFAPPGALTYRPRCSRVRKLTALPQSRPWAHRPDEIKPWIYQCDDIVFMVGLGKDELEVTVAEDETDAKAWVDETQLRRRRSGNPVLHVGLCAYPGDREDVLSLCTAERCLILPHASTRLRRPLPHAVHVFLNHSKVRIFAMEADRLKTDWPGLRNTQLQDLTLLATKAFGRTGRLMADTPKLRGVLGLAESALNLVVTNKPPKLLFKPWNSLNGQICYAAVEAFLVRQVAVSLKV